MVLMRFAAVHSMFICLRDFVGGDEHSDYTAGTEYSVNVLVCFFRGLCLVPVSGSGAAENSTRPD